MVLIFNDILKEELGLKHEVMLSGTSKGNLNTKLPRAVGAWQKGHPEYLKRGCCLDLLFLCISTDYCRYAFSDGARLFRSVEYSVYS